MNRIGPFILLHFCSKPATEVRCKGCVTGRHRFTFKLDGEGNGASSAGDQQRCDRLTRCRGIQGDRFCFERALNQDREVFGSNAVGDGHAGLFQGVQHDLE